MKHDQITKAPDESDRPPWASIITAYERDRVVELSCNCAECFYDREYAVEVADPVDKRAMLIATDDVDRELYRTLVVEQRADQLVAVDHTRNDYAAGRTRGVHDATVGDSR